MGKLADLCNEHGITITFTSEGQHVEEPADKDGRPWKHLRFKVSLHRAGKPDYAEPITYRMGLQDPPRGYRDSAFYKETMAYDRYLRARVPEVDDVIANLVSDGQSYESARNFADFARDFGYSTDSIRALDMYLACGETAKRIRAFLGDLYDAIAEVCQDH